MGKQKQIIIEEEEHEKDFYALLAEAAEEDKVRLVMSILAQVKAGDSAAIKVLEKALLQKQTAGTDGRPIVFMPIELMEREGIEYELPKPAKDQDGV